MKKLFTPLSNGFLIVSLLGVIIFGWYTASGSLPLQWGFTLTFMCVILVVAAMVSATPEDKYLEKTAKK